MHSTQYHRFGGSLLRNKFLHNRQFRTKRGEHEELFVSSAMNGRERIPQYQTLNYCFFCVWHSDDWFIDSREKFKAAVMQKILFNCNLLITNA